ncbi:hypothetical protein KP509_06G069600 [Ceratopteris richardii]|uniref:GST N-terminal domain-containing protein n=1 Tax=Ceratopteris richardii TaxID=49495 RepID=A0A8T2UPU3_CERRI|nr:hypothetical protein KP509_06G069600 [Ceratopteris richardii]
MASLLPSLRAPLNYLPVGQCMPLRARKAFSLPPSAELDNGEPSSVATKEAVVSSPSDASSAAFKAPEPRRFYVRSDKLLDIVGCSLALPMRLGSGALAQGYKVSFVPESQFPSDNYSSFNIAGYKLLETSNLGARPPKPIEIYEFEGCPFCRKVREIVSILDLDVLYYPCPQGGPNFRPKAIQLGGKKQFPYMVDPNTGISMYESDDIIKYLVEKYGNGQVPLLLSLGLLTTLTAGFAMIARMGKGSKYSPAKLPEKPLELWAYEASPFCKIVREVMVELELPHIYHSTPRGSRKRFELFKRVGHFQVPYLEDPNTGVKMFESAFIIEYLQQTYALPKTSSS